ncbi:TPA: 30S ribosomal protein S8 [Candidatus Berkelbacteria bacterium]|uniref:Small ribosomal subunit protein uS8 n=1 Tax=Berkelbacteria bacterium GW2011_GWE1_39_12 TaxID=1618337 RepID=A0A0G4B490_9BACT|nr:MAG: 30S ribosomal protein S8, small subunit ribosomal protein S8 [Berkelbacteria bacterium GW2011_GWE1_39_12]HBO60214.1 30S ribosomal protein S8 [Candidatus Berkelbacteria bacterium]
MDTIANMFTQLKNAGHAGKKEVSVSYSKLNLAILAILKEKGFVASFKEETAEGKKYPNLTVTLSFKANNELSFNDIRRVSRSGRRIYVGAGRLPQLMRGKAEILVSTSKGVMSGTDAKKKGLGGEILGEVV